MTIWSNTGALYGSLPELDTAGCMTDDAISNSSKIFGVPNNQRPNLLDPAKVLLHVRKTFNPHKIPEAPCEMLLMINTDGHKRKCYW